MSTIAFERAQAAKKVPLARLANTPPTTSARYVSALSKDIRKDDQLNLRIKDMMRKEPTELFWVADLPPSLDPPQFYSLKAQLHKE